MIRNQFLTGLFVLFLLFNSCAQKWTKAIRHGEISKHSFSEVVEAQISNGLIILPVNIEGKTYRFLFDTGAMLSVSEELQEVFNMKTVSRGHIKDSDNNREKVKYVRIDSLHIGNVAFTNQTAFVGNFSNNPVIECLNIDGIIGSNLMRFCNWKIDYKRATITLLNKQNTAPGEGAEIIPFRMDRQFSQLIELKFKKATLHKLKIDYGSNGSLSLSSDAFKILKENSILENTVKIKGYSQSGISGKVIKTNREQAIADTLFSANFFLNDVLLKSGKSGLIGTQILRQYVVTINFKDQELYFEPVPDAKPDYSTFGFGLGFDDKKKFYIQWVMENSPASEQGLFPGQELKKIDSLPLDSKSNLCEYIEYRSIPKEEIQLEVLDEKGNLQTVKMKKRFLYH